MFIPNYTTTAIGDEDVSQTTIETLQYFRYQQWDSLSYDDRHAIVIDLVESLSYDLQLSDVPTVRFYSEPESLVVGYFESLSYQIYVNYGATPDSFDMAETIAHEMRHAWQYVRALNPLTEQDELFKYEFENYIEAEDNLGEYYQQSIEVDAREYQVKVIKAAYQ